jgi:hypothetical protein
LGNITNIPTARRIIMIIIITSSIGKLFLWPSCIAGGVVVGWEGVVGGVAVGDVIGG